jgi:NAD(P)-dependent dehydrogenase (short-subunit alcohol dehydrogenase family)
VMALELAEHGITVNAVAPGEISTPMTGQENVDPHTQRRPGVPLGRPRRRARDGGGRAPFCQRTGVLRHRCELRRRRRHALMGPHAGSSLESGDWRRRRLRAGAAHR